MYNELNVSAILEKIMCDKLLEQINTFYSDENNKKAYAEWLTNRQKTNPRTDAKHNSQKSEQQK